MRRKLISGWAAVVACSMLLSGCSYFSLADEQAKKAPDFKPPIVSTDAKLIVKDDGEGIYAANRYNVQKLRAALQNFPANLEAQEIYGRLLALLGENYAEYEEQFTKLDNPQYKAIFLHLKPDPSQTVKSGTTNPEIETHAVILLDLSGSMKGKVNGQTKVVMARKAIKQFVAKLPKRTKVALLVYGYRGSSQNKDKALSCSKTETVYSLSDYNAPRFDKALNRYQPSGWTPLALAIKQAAQDLKEKPGKKVKNVVYVVSDGMETCGGNPVNEAKQLHKSNIQAIVNIIGFDLDEKSKQTLKSVAVAGGGTFESATDEEGLQKAFSRYASQLDARNDSWYAKALETIDQQYTSDNQKLDQTYKSMDARVVLEDKHLNEALDDLYYMKKIDLKHWRDTGDLLDERWYNLRTYAKQRYSDVGGKMDQEWAAQNDKIDQLWVENGGKIDELKQIPRVRIPLPNYKLNLRYGTPVIARMPRMIRSPE
jgi:Ca-activated chloride channel homolog